ncbi:MAG: hypothetical protein ACPGXY_02095 [Alphaproteobacteria bacterium]
MKDLFKLLTLILISGNTAVASEPPELNEIYKNFFLVHAFPVNPLDSKLVMTAGGCVPQTYVLPSQLKTTTIYAKHECSSRPCLYFSVNGMISDQPEINMSIRKYAVILPFTELLAKRVNSFSPTDTAIFGDIDLKKHKGAVLLAPSTVDATGINSELCTIQTYEGRLSEAVNNYIQEKTEWSLVYKDAPKGIECAFFDQALLNHGNINTMGYWENLLNAFPHMSFGIESGPMKNVVAYQIRMLNKYCNQFHWFYGLGAYKAQDKKSRMDATKNLEIRQWALEPLVHLMETTYQFVQKSLSSDQAVGYPKSKIAEVEKAILNLKNYSQTTKKKNRLFSFTAALEWLVYADDKPLKAMLTHKSLRQHADILQAAVYVRRIARSIALGQKCKDEDVKNLEKAVKTLSGKYAQAASLDYGLAWLMNTSYASMLVLPEEERFTTSLRNIILLKLQPLFKNFSNFYVTAENGQRFALALSKFDQRFGINKSYWKKAKKGKIPTLSLEKGRTSENMFM